MSISLIGQENIDIAFFEQQLSVSKTNAIKSAQTKVIEDKNAIQQSGVLLFGIYRNLISSQDGSTCALYPTCSSYCKSAIKRHGILAGGVMTLDRLARCHNFSPERYSIDMSRRKLVDDVEEKIN